MRAIHRLVRTGSVAATVLTAHTALNLRLLRRAPDEHGARLEPISVLLPVRNEENRIVPCLRALAVALDNYPDAECVVLDDCSSDATAELLDAHTHPRIRVVQGSPLPGGWYGKPHACQQAADAAAPASGVLVFLDADVVLAPDALVRTVDLLRRSGLDLVSPYPRQVAGSFAERLVQPLLQWSWSTFLPLRLSERPWPASLAAANGQLLAVDASAYRIAGGHTSVRRDVLDDIALLKVLKRQGFRGVVTDGTDLASCRMYAGWEELALGYEKSLWAAFGASRAGSAMVMALLGVVYVLPPLRLLRRPSDRWAALGTAAGITGRALVARRVGGRVWPDSVAQPASVLVLDALIVRSWRARRRGALRWKDRAL